MVAHDLEAVAARERTRRIPARAGAFALACALALALDSPAQLPAARALLEAGKGAEALAKAEEGLEFAPDDVELLDLASRAAQSAGRTDTALWYAGLALDQALAASAAPAPAPTPAPGAAQKPVSPLVDAIRKRIAELDPRGAQGGNVLAAYSSALLSIGKDCSSRKLYVNAVELLTRCRSDPDPALVAAAEVELAKIYDNKKAVEALLDSGLDVPLKIKKKRNPEAIAKEDAKHSTWDQPFEIKGPQYTIRTDLPRELAESMSLAMEQMNRFYRKVFHVKEHGGGETARVTISVFRTRAEFDAHAADDGKPPDPNVAGFFVPGANIVKTYDPRGEGRSIAFLWETLFHESSHQFTHLISADQIPTWLNEGTASYFEGARLQPNGSIETNLVPEMRLLELKACFDEGKPTLEEVVTYFQPGSYPGEYYPFGWGLVYFLQNYEDDKSQRVYLQPYRDFMAAYGKSGGKHDVLGRFVEHFVTKARQPGVASFADFEKRWRAWMLNLHELYFGPPEKADVLIVRGRKERADKQPDAAEESFRFALRKRSGDAVASFELAELLASCKRPDAAIYEYRRALATLRTVADATQTLPSSGDLTAGDLADLARKGLAKQDKALGDALEKSAGDLARGALDSARAFADAKLPLAALRLLDLSQTVLGTTAELSELREKIAKESRADTRRWRRLPIAADLAGWDHAPAIQADEGALEADAKGPAFCFWTGELPQRFRLEARLSCAGLHPGEGFAALLFGAGGEGVQYLGFSRDGLVEFGELEKGWKPQGELARLEPQRLKSLAVAIEIEADRVQFFLDGEAQGEPRPYAREKLAGAIGFVVQDGQARFSDVRVRY